MSRYKNPSTLECLALKHLGDWIAEQAEKQMEPISGLAHRDTASAQRRLSECVLFLRTYLEYNVPWMLYDILATETIRALTELLEKTKQSHGFRLSMGKFVSQMNIIITMIETLFTKYLTVISIDSIPKIMRSVFYSKLHMLTGLVHLNLGSLSGGWKTSDMETSVIKALKELHHLKYLCINYDCTDNILKCIVSNCRYLEKLDVSCSKSITNESVQYLWELKYLKYIQLYRTYVTTEGFVNILLNCKNLEDIGRCDEIGKVLEIIDVSNPNAGHTFGLTCYVSRYAPQHHLQLAVDMCPLIANMTVFHHSLQGDLMVLVALKQLQDLKLLSCDFYADQVKQILQVKGCNIINLHLEHVDQIDLNALMYISQMCPLLKSLTLYNCTLIQHTSLYTKKLEILPFRNLKRFTCVATCTNEHLMFVLGNSINVEYVQLGTAVRVTDDLFFKIFDKNPLIHLKELRILQSDCLTMVSLQRIIQNCMSLEILVELESWSQITEIDRDYIRNFIKENNLNINTAPVRRYM